MTRGQAAQAKVVALHQLHSILWFHAAKDFAILEAMETSGARRHLALPYVLLSSAQGAHNDFRLCSLAGGVALVWVMFRLFCSLIP